LFPKVDERRKFFTMKNVFITILLELGEEYVELMPMGRGLLE